MVDPTTIGISIGTLGDNMWLNPVLRAFPGAILHMKDDSVCRNVATLHEGLADVQFVGDPGHPRSSGDAIHITEQWLRALGRTDTSIIPHIDLKPEEVAWAREFLAAHGDPAKMVVIHTHNSGWTDITNDLARQLKPPHEATQQIADHAAVLGYQPVQFCNAPFPGKADNFDPLDRTVHIRGLTLRQTAACYHLIKRMVCGDTGDPYVMLAVGGAFIMLLAPETGGYRHSSVRYEARHWNGGQTRAKYVLVENWREVLAHLDFRFAGS